MIKKHAQICNAGTNNTVFAAASSVPLTDKRYEFPPNLIEALGLPENIKTLFDYKILIGTYQRLWDFTIISICSDIESFFKDLYDSKYPGNNKRFGFYQRMTDVISDLTGRGIDFTSINSDINTLKMSFQQRHVFIHNLGYVDQNYIDNTGSLLSLNDRLIIIEEDYKKAYVAYGKLLKVIDNATK